MTRELTPDDLEFIEAYDRNVSDAPREVVRLYLLSFDDFSKAFYEDYSEYYTGLADAHGVWEDALKYARRGTT